MQRPNRLPVLARTLLPLLALGALAPTGSAQEGASAPAVVMLKLRDGSLSWGRIEEHDPERIAFRRMDNGGLARVPWSLLDPGQELELRTRFGYVELEGEEIYTEASRIVMIDGQERIGLVLGRTETSLIVKDAVAQLELPLNRIRTEQAGLRVPARDIFTRAELYNQELGRTDPLDPAEQYELGKFCERILEFQYAFAHYTLAATLDPSFKPDELAAAQERALLKAGQQVQLDALDEADRLRRRRAYDQARALLADFQATFVGSPLQADRKKLEDRVEKDRLALLRDQVRRRWLARMERVADQTARKSYAEVLAFLEEGFSQAIVEGVTQDLRPYKAALTPDEVRQLWVERPRGRWRPASYGGATWLLGEDAALKGSQPETEQAQPRTALERERAELAERLRRFLQNQEAARRTATLPSGEEVDQEGFWRSLSSAVRRNWIIANYAENSGDLEVRPAPDLTPCPGCAGTGTREQIHTGGTGANNQAGVRKVVCETCQGIGVQRRIRYR